MINGQTTIFDMIYPKFKIDRPIRLIETFSGYGSQALSLKYLGAEFEHWKTCEWAIKSIQAYKDIHFPDDNDDYSMLNNLSYEKLVDILYNYGISQNYNEPMKLKQIKRLGEKQVRKIFNNIVATHNLVNIQKVKGYSLEIVDTDKYCYIMTYSFPCQDLSTAGKRKGMSDTSTRSGMLWEIERILSECENLPQVLLMENVPQVHGEDNLEDFNKWKYRLEELGYKNYFQDLIATDYGIPQTRNRCFMVSILGDYNYTFPKPIPLKLKLKDLLEESVPEKYYLSDKMINCFINPSESGKNYGRDKQFLRNLENNEIASTITTAAGNRATDNFINESNIKKQLCNELIEQGKIKENDVIRHNYTTSKNGNCIQSNNESPTLDTRCDCLGVCVGTYQYAKSDNFMQGRDRLQLGKEVSDTLQTTQKEGVVILGNYTPSNHNASRIVDSEYLAPTVMENHGTITATKTKDLRIRKLTPKECFRLMGVKDEDYEKCAKNQSNASLYHLAGDSIVVNVLMAIFKEML